MLNYTYSTSNSLSKNTLGIFQEWSRSRPRSRSRSRSAAVPTEAFNYRSLLSVATRDDHLRNGHKESFDCIFFCLKSSMVQYHMYKTEFIP